MGRFRSSGPKIWLFKKKKSRPFHWSCSLTYGYRYGYRGAILHQITKYCMHTDLCGCTKCKSICINGWFDLNIWHAISGVYEAKPGEKDKTPKILCEGNGSSKFLSWFAMFSFYLTTVTACPCLKFSKNSLTMYGRKLSAKNIKVWGLQQKYKCKTLYHTQQPINVILHSENECTL